MTKKKIANVLLFIAFIFGSILLFNTSKKSPISEYRSDNLSAVLTIDGNITRTDYLDSEGILRIAANLGYATKIVTREEQRELEIYLDDRGEKVSRVAGVFGILRDYDEEGNNIRITYLNAQNEPVITSEGYSIEERTYNERKQQITSRYLDTFGQPVRTRSYGYGRRNEYDENGMAFRVTYVDQLGQPMAISAGYTIIEREFYLVETPNIGKVKKEFYFDSQDNPVALSLGQYGLYREYNDNGQTSLVTYLDADGNPITTNKGYTTLKYTYHADNSVATVMYYDINGKPFRMPEGQYGAKNENGQTIYLKADGNAQFNIKNLVYNDSRSIVLIAFCIAIVSSVIGKRLNWLLMFAYIGAIIYFTLMYRETRGKQQKI